MLFRFGGGVLVNPNDPEDLAKSLKELLEDRPRREEMGRKGRAAVHESFTADKMAQTTYDYYVRLLERSSV